MSDSAQAGAVPGPVPGPVSEAGLQEAGLQEAVLTEAGSDADSTSPGLTSKLMGSLSGLKTSAANKVKKPLINALKEFAKKYPNKSIGLSIFLYGLAAVLIVLGVGSIAAALSTSLNILGSLVPILQSSTNPLLMGLVSSIVGGLAALKARVLSKEGVRESQKEIETIGGTLSKKDSLKQLLNNILVRSVVEQEKADRRKEFISNYADYEDILELYYQEARNEIAPVKNAKVEGVAPKSPLDKLMIVVDKKIKPILTEKLQNLIEEKKA